MILAGLFLSAPFDLSPREDTFIMTIGLVEIDGNVTTLEVPDDITPEQEKALICERFNINPDDVEWDF